MLSKIRFILLLSLAPFVLLAQSGSSSSPFTSVGQASAVTSPGTYYFNLGGTSFSTYVNGAGELLVAMNYGQAGAASLAATTAMTNSQNGILSPSVLSALSGITQVRITSNGNTPVDVYTTDATVISRLQNNVTLNQGMNDNALNATWQGTGVMTATICNTDGSIVLADKITHPCGNPDAILWAPLDGAQDESYTNIGILPSTAYLQLWVKGTSTAQPAPVITSPTTASGTVGSPFSYQITASNSPSSFGATGLPSGLSVNSTGLISGTPTADGTSTVSVAATNGTGTGTASVAFTIAPSGTPSGIYLPLSGGSLTGRLGIGTANPAVPLEVNGDIRSFSTASQSSLTLCTSGINIGPRVVGSLRYATAAGVTYDFMRTFIAGNYDDVTGISFLTNNGGGTTEKMRITNLGNVLIGKTNITNPAYLLDVAGAVRADKVVINTDGADFVFEPNYQLKPLAEVESFVKQNRHLPGIAPAAKMQKDGMEIGESQTKLLQKVEELTLYAIEQDKKQQQYQTDIKEQKQLIAEQTKLLQQLQKEVAELKKSKLP